MAARGKGRPRCQSAALWAASLRVTAAIDPFERLEGIAGYHSATRHDPSLSVQFDAEASEARWTRRDNGRPKLRQAAVLH